MPRLASSARGWRECERSSALRGCPWTCYDSRLRTLGTMSFFFFFQAEDGIRDLTVTGVQTCALPIFGLVGLRVLVGPPDAGAEPLIGRHEPGAAQAVGGPGEAPVPRRTLRGLRVRSEERRVGKKCRSRWSPDH